MNNTQWQEELHRVKAILDQFPLEKTTKWGTDVYTFNGKNVVSCGGFKHFFTLWFYNGVFLTDPHQVLIAASEGKTKSLRQWRFHAASEIDEERIRAYVQEAIEVEKQGLRLAPEKFVAIPPDPIFQSALLEDPAFARAFQHLTPGKQKEYILYIQEAKQAATKHKRMDKIKPLILARKGLNDKYK